MRKTSPRGLVRTLFDMPIYGSNSVPYSCCNNTYSVGTADPSALHSISWWHAENCTVHIYSWSELYSTLCSQTEGKNGEALGFMARLLYRHYIYMLHIPGDVTIPESWEESELSMPVSQISFELHVWGDQLGSLLGITTPGWLCSFH